MKKIVVLCLTVFCLSLVGCNQGVETSSSPKVVVVDPAKVFQESKPGKDGMAYLEKVSKEVQQEFKALQQKAAEDKDANKNVTDIQAQVQVIQKRVAAEQQMVVGKLNEAFQKVLQAYRSSNNVALVLPVEQALSFDDSVNATSDIIEAMNKETVTFESQKQPALEKETPAEPADKKPADEKPADSTEEKPASN